MIKAVVSLAVVAAHTSEYVRPGASRVLQAREIHPSCGFTFTTYQNPGDDYFRGAACESQIHVSVASKSSAVVTYVSASPTTSSRVKFGTSRLERVARGVARSYASLMSVDSYLWAPKMGAPFATPEEVKDMANTTAWAAPGSSSRADPPVPPEGLAVYKNPGAIYSSPVIHTVVLEDLVPGVRYYYAVPSSVGAVRTFQFPKLGYPFVLGLTADVGQTAVSNRTLTALRAMEPDAVLLAGDLSYSDGWAFRWDTFGKLAEPLASSIPVLVTGGNHEIGSSENWLHFLERWPTPHVASYSTSPLYWSVDIGPVHVIALNSYDNYVRGGDRLQREWLVDDLDSIDRGATPWVVVMMHAPFYTSNYAHPGEAELMRQAYEPLLYAYGADLVLSGHVHAYERSTSGVYDAEVDKCGPTYLNIGDGGNRENTGAHWIHPQPAWSIFRESSFGFGRLELVDDRTAKFEWRRDACGSDDPGAYTFDPACVTPADDSGTHLAVDHIVLEKVSAEECRAARDAVRPNKDDAAAEEARQKRRARAERRRAKARRRDIHLSWLVIAALACFVLGCSIASVFARDRLLVKAALTGPTVTHDEVIQLTANTYTSALKLTALNDSAAPPAADPNRHPTNNNNNNNNV
ncbi:hypothetical protein CTAYLR_003270 [Chrysophaeum taylorii]|uniref:Purple acid phosphatase n=1 Tax=Chrysophaeum taylorii TaxID=2483200 RepID=A0AAD7XH49_9STRA|nr:hypothetical protein CTAYLR_003270 [Chrysophaeum taylorii]